MRKKLLFVCSYNKARSPEAERVVNESYADRYEARSAGLSGSARSELTTEMVEWADEIYVMEDGQRTLLHVKFPQIEKKDIRVLSVPTFSDIDMMRTVTRGRLVEILGKPTAQP